MHKILLTGSNGFLGQHIARKAQRQKYIEITGWSSKPATHNFCDHFRQLDFLKTTLKPEMVKSFDIVIHTAAMSHVDLCEKHKQEAFRINTEATRQLAKCCCKAGTKLVHISTDFVFPGKDRLVKEDDKTAPVNFYGRTKEAAELYVQNIMPESTIIRPVLIFGNTLAGTRSNLVLWVKKSLEECKPIKVTKNHFRTATYVDDLAELCINAALNPHPGIYHACGSSYLSVFEMAMQVAKAFNLNQTLISPVHSNELNAKGERPPCTHFHAEKAINQFGFKNRTFDEALYLMEHNKF